jgi:hypothetical protein
MRFVRLTDAILDGLRTLSTAHAHANASDEEQRFVQLAAQTANNALALPELALPADLTPELEAYRAENTRLAADNTRLQAMIDRLLATPAQPQEPRVARNEKMPDIPMFDGTRAKLQPWIDQLWLKLADEGRYTNLQSKLVYAFSRCEGAALDHLRPNRRDGTLNFVSVQALIDVLEQAFEDPDRRGTARRTLLTLRQDGDDFPTFYAKFQAQVPHAGMDDGGLLAAMTEAVNPRIREKMIGITPVPETLADFVTRARAIDAGFRAEKERKAGTTHSLPAPQKRPAQRAPTTTTTTTTATGTEPGPMDLSRKQGSGAYPRLSLEERQRRLRQGLCFRCGGQGHMSTACPLNTPRPARVAAIDTPATAPQEESSSAAANTTEQSEN